MGYYNPANPLTEHLSIDFFFFLQNYFFTSYLSYNRRLRISPEKVRSWYFYHRTSNPEKKRRDITSEVENKEIDCVSRSTSRKLNISHSWRKRQQNAHLRASWGKGGGITTGNQNSAFHIHFLLNPPQTQRRKGWALSLKLQILTQSELLCYLKWRGLEESTLKTTLVPHHRLSLSPAQFCKGLWQGHCRAQTRDPLIITAAAPSLTRSHTRTRAVTKLAANAFYFRF